jgi:Restriction endonuclease
MAHIDTVYVCEMFRRSDRARTHAEKGRLLEDLIAYLFELIPGVSITARNAMNAFDAQEIDIAFWNDGDVDGLRLFDHLLLVECKNWSTPVGYPELAVFYDKLQSRGRPIGILIATEAPRRASRATSSCGRRRTRCSCALWRTAARSSW